MFKSRSRHEVVVVGARVAGAATAMLLARKGHDVALVDRATFPSDTLSTHALSRGGVVQLQRWGLLDDLLATGTPPIRNVLLARPGNELLKPIKDKAGVDLLVAPRRHVLDHLLVRAALDSGVTLHTGVAVTGLLRDFDGRIRGISAEDRLVEADVTVGADGVWSHVAEWVDAPIIDARPSNGAAQYAYFAGLQQDTFEFHVADRTFAGVFPTNDGEANVWVCSPTADRRHRFEDLIQRAAPDLARRLSTAHRTSRIYRAHGLPNHVRQAYGPGWALVGDAGYHRDPITGHGITDALRDAELLANAIDDGDLSSYQRQRDDLIKDIFDITVGLGAYPRPEQFVELQLQLARAIDVEADVLAALPPIDQRVTVAA